MFGLAWSEILLIGVVALVFIGPKDLPVAMRAVAVMVRRARGMAREFQGHVDEMMKEADLQGVRDQLHAVRRTTSLRSVVTRHLDGDGAIRDTLRDDPFKTALDSKTVDVRPAHEVSLPDHPPAPPASPEAGHV